jgi:hypothetical protein
MRELISRELLSKAIPHLLTDVSQCEQGTFHNWPLLPDAANIWGKFPVRRVIKKGQVGRDKSIKGFVWIDGTRSGVLLNKFCVQSCHTLDNREYDYRTGNYNHVFNPFAASIFGYRNNPYDSIIPAKSPATGNYYRVREGGAVSAQYTSECDVQEDALRVYRHTATANVFLALHQDRPYIVLAKIYETCAENPWHYSFVRYLRTHAKKLGYGFAIGSSSDTIVDMGNGKSATLPYNGMATLHTPAYTCPLASVFQTYHDDGLCYAVGDKSWSMSIEATIIDKARNASFDASEWAADTSSMKVFYNDTCMDDSSTVCEACGYPMHEDNAWYSPNGGTAYCQDCYSERFAYCESCENDLGRDELMPGPYGGDYCESCWRDLFVRCYDCEQAVKIEDSIEIDGDSYCPKCAESRQNVCDKCGEHCVELHDHLVPAHEAAYERDLNPDYNPHQSAYVLSNGNCTTRYYAQGAIVPAKTIEVCDDCYDDLPATCSDCGRQMTRNEVYQPGNRCAPCYSAVSLYSFAPGRQLSFDELA